MKGHTETRDQLRLSLGAIVCGGRKDRVCSLVSDQSLADKSLSLQGRLEPSHGAMHKNGAAGNTR